MLSHRLISFNNRLTSEFVKHIESANNLCIYRLGSHYIPPKISFPNADTVTLINCTRTGISSILNHSILPNITRINYLSTHPGDYSIYERIRYDVDWVFPDKAYDFYDYMVSAGRGKKDPLLIKRYIANKRIIDGHNGFDISFNFDLNVPGFGITDGQWWSSQFYEYLVTKQNNVSISLTEAENLHIMQEIEEYVLQKEHMKAALENDYFNCIIEHDIHNDR